MIINHHGISTREEGEKRSQNAKQHRQMGEKDTIVLTYVVPSPGSARLRSKQDELSAVSSRIFPHTLGRQMAWFYDELCLSHRIQKKDPR